MSPEQAEGKLESLGPSSDVYGLGATMYSILTGVPPISKEPGEEILERVRSGKITPPRELNQDIPEALQAICLKALARKQSDRYPSSAGLAEDIELWLSDEAVSAFREPWMDRAARYMRRHRTAVITALAVLTTSSIALLAVNTLVRQQNTDLRIARDKSEVSRQEALLQKTRAEENLVVARSLSMQMLTTAEQKLSAAVISSSVILSTRVMLTEQAYTNFQSLYERNRDDYELAFEFAKTCRLSANLKRLMLDYQTAGQQIEKSLQIQLQFPPDQLTLKRKDYLAETYRDIGTLRKVEGRLKDADGAFASALAIVKELEAAEPQSTNFMRTRALIEVEQIGLHIDRMELDLALEKAQSSASTFQKLIDTGASNTQDPLVLLLSLARQVHLLYDLGRVEEAKAITATSMEAGAKWRAARPDDENVALPVARTLCWSAEGLVDSEGPSEEATDRVEKALAIYDDLVKKRFQSSYLYGQGNTLRLKAKTLRLQGKLNEAEPLLAKSRTVLETLVKAADKGGNRDVLAKTIHELAMLKQGEKNKTAAIEFMKEAVEIQNEACRLSPESLELKSHLKELSNVLEKMEKGR